MPNGLAGVKERLGNLKKRIAHWCTCLGLGIHRVWNHSLQGDYHYRC
jgi:hypothetical protein